MIIAPWLKGGAHGEREVVDGFAKHLCVAGIELIVSERKHLHVVRPGTEWDEGRGGKVTIGIDDMDWVVCLIVTIIMPI